MICGLCKKVMRLAPVYIGDKKTKRWECRCGNFCPHTPKLTFDEWVEMCPVGVVANLQDCWWDYDFSDKVGARQIHLRRGPNHEDPHEAPVTAIIVERKEP